jgi:Fic family protein
LRSYGNIAPTRPLLHREAILSSRIEGTITTPQDLVLFEVSGASGASKDSRVEDAKEVANYISAMQHGLRPLKELPVCLRLLREIHGELLKGVRGERERPGEFRDGQNSVGNPGQPIAAARFVPPPVPEMMECLDAFERYVNRRLEPDDHPPVIELALVHYQFETIHPFRDGNGRIGRLLMPLLLCCRGRMPEPLLYLSSYFERNREQYMDLLLRVSQKGDWDSWLHFFLSGVIDCAEEAVRQAERLLTLRDQYHRQFQSARSSALLQKLIDNLFQAPAITIGQASKVLHVTPAAAAYNIAKLEKAGILEEVMKRRKGKIFLARGILALLQDSVGSKTAERADVVQTSST